MHSVIHTSCGDDPTWTPELTPFHEALVSLFTEESHYLRRVAIRRLRDPVDADDVLQSAFCSAWQAIAEFRGQSSLKTWLVTIVANRAATFTRSHRVRRAYSLDEEPSYLLKYEYAQSQGCPTPEQIVSTQQEALENRKLLLHLRAETRRIFNLYYFAGLSIPDIATRLQKSQKAVASQLGRGRAVLRGKAARSLPCPTSHTAPGTRGLGNKACEIRDRDRSLPSPAAALRTGKMAEKIHKGRTATTSKTRISPAF